MDVRAIGFPHCLTALYDARISDATGLRYRNNQRPGSCAKEAESEKCHKYEEPARSAGHIFYPFVAELDGWAGEKLLLVLRQLGHFRATQFCSAPQAIKTLRSRLVTK